MGSTNAPARAVLSLWAAGRMLGEGYQRTRDRVERTGHILPGVPALVVDVDRYGRKRYRIPAAPFYRALGIEDDAIAAGQGSDARESVV